jgi:hypothetical protein
MASFGRIIGSNFGPSMRKSRLVYTAVVRPTMLYGIQAWGLNNRQGKVIRAPLKKQLKQLQRQCLKMVTGAYKRTPLIAMERDFCVQPIDLFIEQLILEWAGSVKKDQVENDIRKTLDLIWKDMERREESSPGTARRGRPPVD